MDINIKITIDDRIIRFFKKSTNRRKVMIAALIFSLAIPLAIYAANAPHTFKAGEVASASQMNTNFSKLYDCPEGMVHVGDFCVDKYEASVWSSATGGTQYGASSDDYPCNNNGNDCSNIYARSISGVTPSGRISWFQAAAACANSGKHLITNEEWQVAAAGTTDTSTGSSAGPNCATDTGNSGPMTTGNGSSCLSRFGVENMIGSMSEWVSMWVGHPGTNRAGGAGAVFESGYGSDTYVHGGPVNGGADRGSDGSWRPKAGLDAVSGEGDQAADPVSYAGVVRGGLWNSGSAAGVFHVDLSNAPSRDERSSIGFRCAKHL